MREKIGSLRSTGRTNERERPKMTVYAARVKAVTTRAVNPTLTTRRAIRMFLSSCIDAQERRSGRRGERALAHLVVRRIPVHDEAVEHDVPSPVGARERCLREEDEKKSPVQVVRMLAVINVVNTVFVGAQSQARTVI
jgi:hypothetical protein